MSVLAYFTVKVESLVRINFLLLNIEFEQLGKLQGYWKSCKEYFSRQSYSDFTPIFHRFSFVVFVIIVDTI